MASPEFRGRIPGGFGAGDQIHPVDIQVLADPREAIRNMRSVAAELMADEEFLPYREAPRVFYKATLYGSAVPRAGVRNILAVRPSFVERIARTPGGNVEGTNLASR